MGAMYGKGGKSYSTGIELKLFGTSNVLECYCPILHKAALERDSIILFYTNKSIIVGKEGERKNSLHGIIKLLHHKLKTRIFSPRKKNGSLAKVLTSHTEPNGLAIKWEYSLDGFLLPSGTQL